MGSAAIQGRLWGASVTDWLDNEPFCTPVYDAVFDELTLPARSRLLDLGCGAGLAMSMAEERGLIVSGFDASGPMIDVARSRVPGADIRQGDLEALPYDDGTFACVTSFNAVQFAADPVAALGEARRVTTPGGKVAIVTWGEMDKCESRFLLADVAALVSPGASHGQGPFALSEPGKLEAFARDAGLTPISIGDVAAPFTFSSLDEAVRIQASAGPIQRAIEVAGTDATIDT
ncbi:MAG: class I SAM-dependent methyltransferase, partial [Actinobacteria bacterium]|nr:class I SAM-dependent methyltransferase [Actinomycetota bacterium]